MKKSTLFLTFLVFLSVFGSGYSQTVDEIISKNLKSKGGIEKINAVKSFKMMGKIVFQGMEMPTTIYWKRPNLLRSESSFQGQTVIQAFDGEKGWTINPFMGNTEPQELPKEQIESLKEQADFEGDFVNYKEKGTKIELLGKEEFEGTPVYKLKVTTKDGKEKIYYLETESCLEIKMEMQRDIQGTPATVSTIFSDYKDVDGLKIAFSIQVSAGAQFQTNMIIEAVELNLDIDDSLFKIVK